MVSETIEMVYQACPSCQQEYFSKPKVPVGERYTNFCKLCLEEAIEESLQEDEEPVEDTLDESRPFEVERKDSRYTIKIGGETSTVKWNQGVFDDLEKYHPGVNVNGEVIAMIIQELNLEFNLTDQELREYAQTLKYILED